MGLILSLGAWTGSQLYQTSRQQRWPNRLCLSLYGTWHCSCEVQDFAVADGIRLFQTGSVTPHVWCGDFCLPGKRMWQLLYCKGARHEACWVGRVMFPMPSVAFIWKVPPSVMVGVPGQSAREKKDWQCVLLKSPTAQLVCRHALWSRCLFPEKVGDWAGGNAILGCRHQAVRSQELGELFLMLVFRTSGDREGHRGPG